MTTYRLAFPRTRVFAAINDPGLLQRCVSGCEKVTRTGEDSYDAYVKFGVGMFQGQCVVKLQFRDANAPESITLSLEGKAAPGQVKTIFRIRLTDRACECEVHCELEVQVSGMIALMGSRRIETAAWNSLAQFFRNFSAELAK